MQIQGGKVPKARELSRFGRELSRTGQLRLVWMSHYLRHGRNAAFTCRHFGISRQTFYRWWRRYDPHRKPEVFVAQQDDQFVLPPADTRPAVPGQLPCGLPSRWADDADADSASGP